MQTAQAFAPHAIAVALLATPMGIRHDLEEKAYTDFGTQFPAVVQISGLASGVLIHQHWVLTVAHAPEMLHRMRPDAPLTVRIGKESFTVDRVAIPEARKDQPRQHDIALLHLEKPAPKTVKPLPLHTKKVAADSPFALVGWGILASGDEGVKMSREAMASPTRARRAGRNQVTRNEAEKGLLFATFDAPSEEEGGALDLEAAPCIGDSGGPILIEKPRGKGKPSDWLVAGVIAAIDDGDGDRIVSEYGEEFAATAVHPYLEWIRETIEE